MNLRGGRKSDAVLFQMLVRSGLTVPLRLEKTTN